MPQTCIIIGGGVVGPAAALALTKQGIQCTIYELRQTPSTIGGAINLTPNGLRILSMMGVDVPGWEVEHIDLFSLETGSRLGEVPFRTEAGKARRVIRATLQSQLLAAVDAANIKIEYGAKLTSITENTGEGTVTATFADGTTSTANFILGCDGAHSVTRTSWVDTDPDNLPKYTGISVSYSFVDSSLIKAPFHFKSTAVNMSAKGSLLTSFCDPDKSRVYIGAVMQTPSPEDGREGWKAKGSDHEATSKEIIRRWGDSVVPCVPQLIANAKDLFLYPVYALPNGGKWIRGRVLLLGDAAHNMPPQGESVGLAIEDACLLAKIFDTASDPTNVERVFATYEKTRRPRIHESWIEANKRWENVKDRSWPAHKMMELFTWLYCWYMKKTWESNQGYQIEKEEIKWTD